MEVLVESGVELLGVEGVRRRDRDGVEVLAFDHRLVVHVPAVFVQCVLRTDFGELFLVDVGDRADRATVVALEIPDQLTAQKPGSMTPTLYWSFLPIARDMFPWLGTFPINQLLSVSEPFPAHSGNSR